MTTGSTDKPDIWLCLAAGLDDGRSLGCNPGFCEGVLPRCDLDTHTNSPFPIFPEPMLRYRVGGIPPRLLFPASIETQQEIDFLDTFEITVIHNDVLSR